LTWTSHKKYLHQMYSTIFSVPAAGWCRRWKRHKVHFYATLYMT
jgi:hypothetical protein